MENNEMTKQDCATLLARLLTVHLESNSVNFRNKCDHAQIARVLRFLSRSRHCIRTCVPGTVEHKVDLDSQKPIMIGFANIM